MHFHELANDVRNDLLEKGLRFVRVEEESLGITFEAPRGWNLSRGPDGECIQACHGEPPAGHLYLTRSVPERLGDDPWTAFLDANIMPSPKRRIVIGATRAIETEETAHLVEFEVSRDGEHFSGQAMRLTDARGALMSAYVTSESLYHPGLVRRLLMATLDSVVVPARTDPAGKSLFGVPVSALWRVPSEPATIPFAPPGGRFALKLPNGWQSVEIHDDGAVGWLLVPKGERPGAPGTPLVTVSADDLVADLAPTLQSALEILLDAGTYTRALPPRLVSTGDQSGVVHVYRGRPPGVGDAPPLGAWSFGVTDGATVAHLLAVTSWSRLATLLDPLNAIARSLRVLPRTLNRDLMARFQGYWRYFDTHEEVKEVAERCYHFRSDGTFGFIQRRVDRREAIHHPPEPSKLAIDTTDGTWDIVETTLTMIHADGRRERLDIDGVSKRTAVVGRVLWERLQLMDP